jgi:hypothetical protein
MRIFRGIVEDDVGGIFFKKISISTNIENIKRFLDLLLDS